jgi:hypothetical protein
MLAHIQEKQATILAAKEQIHEKTEELLKVIGPEAEVKVEAIDATADATADADADAATDAATDATADAATDAAADATVPGKCEEASMTPANLGVAASSVPASHKRMLDEGIAPAAGMPAKVSRTELSKIVLKKGATLGEFTKMWFDEAKEFSQGRARQGMHTALCAKFLSSITKFVDKDTQSDQISGAHSYLTSLKAQFEKGKTNDRNENLQNFIDNEVCKIIAT